MQKLKNIDFLRVIGCITIILLHLFAIPRLSGLFPDIGLYTKLQSMTSNGQKAVDLFFIISGFFFALKLNTTKSILDFLKNKLIRLYPVLIFITLLCFIASLFGTMDFKWYDNILNLLFLGGTPLFINYSNIGISWYISAMLWTFILFYYLLKNYEKKHVHLTFAILIFFCYSFLIHTKGGKIYGTIQTYYNVFNLGMLRAIGGIGIGYFIAEWYKSNIEQIKTLTLNIKQRLCLTVFEFMCVFFIINNLILHKPHFKNHIVFIIVFALTIILFLVNKGYISTVLNNNIWLNLSKYTYSLYMTHLILFNILRGSFWKYHPEWVYAHPVLNIELALTLALLLGVFTYHFVEVPCARYLKEKFQNPYPIRISGGGSP